MEVEHENVMVRRILKLLSPKSFLRSWEFITGFTIVLIFTITSFFGTYFIPYSGTVLHLSNRFAAPSFNHPFGTDYLGRDVLARTFEGGKVSLIVGISAGALTIGIGGIIGIFSGYYGKLVDLGIQRIVDVVLAIPSIVFTLVLVSIVGYSTATIVFAISLLSWPSLARVTRSETLSLRERDFVSAEVLAGASNIHIIFRHLIPNETRTFVVYSGLSISSAILIQAALAYLGFSGGGISWGFDLYNAQQYIANGSWWMMFFPGVALTLTSLGFYLISEGLRRTLKE